MLSRAPSARVEARKDVAAACVLRLVASLRLRMTNSESVFMRAGIRSLKRWHRRLRAVTKSPMHIGGLVVVARY